MCHQWTQRAISTSIRGRIDVEISTSKKRRNRKNISTLFEKASKFRRSTSIVSTAFYSTSKNWRDFDCARWGRTFGISINEYLLVKNVLKKYCDDKHGRLSAVIFSKYVFLEIRHYVMCWTIYFVQLGRGDYFVLLIDVFGSVRLFHHSQNNIVF